jgi:hypothetical protein
MSLGRFFFRNYGRSVYSSLHRSYRCSGLARPLARMYPIFHLYFMLGSMGTVVFGVFWYIVYVFAYLGRPGLAGRTVGIAGVLLFPVLLIAAALLVGGIGAVLGVPQQTFWDYLDRWTPIETWRTRQVPPAADLDDAVRGNRPKDLWLTFGGDLKYVDCLHHNVAVMRRRVGLAKGPADLLIYYPHWVRELDACSRLYKPDPKRSEKLREALATQMATVLGQETASYLTMQRLYALDPKAPAPGRAGWIDNWRAFAVIGVASTTDVLEDAK